LNSAKVTEEDVMNFWASQPFDLQLQSYEGNCDFCFLKSKRRSSVWLRSALKDSSGGVVWSRRRGKRFVETGRLTPTSKTRRSSFRSSLRLLLATMIRTLASVPIDE